MVILHRPAIQHPIHVWMKYPCPRCGHVFAKQAWLNRHLARKRPCAASPDDDPIEVKKRTCPHCSKLFTSRGGMQRHVKATCKKVGQGDETRTEKAENRADGLAIIVQNQQKQLAALAAKLTALEEREGSGGGRSRSGGGVSGSGGDSPQPPGTNAGVIASACGGGTVAVDARQDNRVNIEKVEINVYGAEGCAHITRNTIGQILNKAREVGGGDEYAVSQAAVLRTGEAIYSALPENITAYQRNKREKEAVVRRAGGWEARSAGVVAREMAVRSINEIFNKQPLENLLKFEAQLKSLAEHETDLVGSGLLLDVLKNNKAKLQRFLAVLPRAGTEP